MKICFDMRPALSRPTGVGVYLQNLTRTLAEIDEENEYVLFSSSWKERFPALIYGSNFRVADFRYPVGMLTFLWNRLGRPYIEDMLDEPVDVAHSPTPLVIPSRNAHRVTTVCDLYFYSHPEHVQREMRRDYPVLVREHCLRSDAVIAISEHTKRQMTELLDIPSARIHVIRLGSDPFFLRRADAVELDSVRRKYALDAPYFLFVGSDEPRKNLPMLLSAFTRLDRDALLVVAGPTASGSGAVPGERVRRTGYLRREELRALYQGAVALVFPSREEGFGLPLLEAMASQTPILASDIPVFHEICGNSCYMVHSDDIEGWTAALRKVYDEPSFREDLVEKGKERVQRYSWREAALRTLDLYRNL